MKYSIAQNINVTETKSFISLKNPTRRWINRATIKLTFTAATKQREKKCIKVRKCFFFSLFFFSLDTEKWMREWNQFVYSSLLFALIFSRNSLIHSNFAVTNVCFIMNVYLDCTEHSSDDFAQRVGFVYGCRIFMNSQLKLRCIQM